MSFSAIIGNDQIKKQLLSMTSKDAVGNSLLFTGPDGIGKSLFAYELAKILFCKHDPQGLHQKKLDHQTHPDMRIYRPEGKTGMHSIQAMRDFHNEVYLPPYEAESKIFIIHEADRMLTYSANALLKTFEEPAVTSIIILLSSCRYAMLPTILSRCRVVYFSPISSDDIAHFLQAQHHVEPVKAKAIASCAQGSVGRALQLLHEGVDAQQTTASGLLLALLAQGRGKSYHQLTQVIQQIHAKIEEMKKSVEEAAKTELLKAFSGDLSATQQQILEKEVEGSVSIRYLHEVNALLEIVLGWYRDMQLLSVQGNSNYLLTPLYREQIEQALQRGELLPLEKVQKAAAAMKLAVERSTPFATALETLLLTLGTSQ